MTDKIVVLTTCDNEEEASRLAKHLVDGKFAACVNILPSMRSVYRWNEKVEEATEFQLVIKSRRDLFEKLRAEIAKIHSYEIPEVIVIPVIDGSPEYLIWIDRELS